MVFTVFRTIAASAASTPRALCTHQLARVPLFRLLSLAARFIAHVVSCAARVGDAAWLAEGGTAGSKDGTFFHPLRRILVTSVSLYVRMCL